MIDATIHLRVPAATKGRWVRASRTAGMRLTDWIMQAVEAYMQQATTISIPEGVSYSDLKLTRDADGGVSFDWSPIERICAASGLDVELYRTGPEDHVCQLITHWYNAHVAAGGERDPASDDLIAEVQIEDAHGQHTSHHPGRA